jgi:glycosyltransferase involved in cell wall biosynthesis
VVTVCRNAEATIGVTLASVAEQELGPGVLEHLVIDGASADGTCDLVRAAPHGPRLISEPDAGIYDAFNKGLALARGDLIAFLNADDVYAHPQAVSRVLAATEQDPEADVFHADMEVVDEDDRVLRRIELPLSGARHGTPCGRSHYAVLAFRMAVHHPTTFVRRRAFARVGGFDTRLRVSADHDWFLRAWRDGVTFHHIPEVLSRMRAGGVSEQRYWLGRLESLQAARRHGTPTAAALAELLRYETSEALRGRSPRLFALARRLKRSVWGRSELAR